MDSVRKAAGALFYILGSVVIVLVVLVERGVAGVRVTTLLHILDLPLLFTAMLYGGTSLYTSLAQEKRSLPLLLVIMVPLGVIFALFCTFNFGFPFREL